LVVAPPIPIPAEVRAWLTGVFGSCNAQVANLITDVPTTHETAVDMAFIQSFSHVSAPYRFPSGWTVELSTHYLGGGRHWSAWPDQPPRWEIADIGLLVMYRQDGKLLRSKVALLQSKRLYPDELEWDEDSALDYMIGFRRLFPDEGQWSAVTAPRPFSFTEQSRYKALVTGVNQYRVIEDYESQRGIPVYYLLYNPVRLPSTVVFPISAGQQRAPSPCDVGARVVPAVQVRAVMTDKPIGSSPSYDDLCASLQAPFVSEGNRGGWRLEHFVVDLLLDCETGYVANSPDDAGLDYVFNRRTGPISAAVAVTLDAPA
jgi:hypothetical protein